MQAFFISLIFILFAAFVPVQAQTVFQVNSTEDDADTSPGDGVCLTSLKQCTLRAAIEEANAHPNGTSLDVIRFANIPLLNGTAVIFTLGDGLPEITDPIDINGESAPGEVIINGAFGDPLTGRYGLHLGAGSSGSVIRNLSIGEFSTAGIYLESDHNVVEKNFLGVSEEGHSLPNRSGIEVFGDYNRIGGVLKRNVIGNSDFYGIVIRNGYGTIIRSNYIGVSPQGEDIGNTISGINVYEARNATIGGPTVQYGNRIGYNLSGILLSESSSDVVIRNNFIGTDAAGNDYGNFAAGIGIGDGGANHLIGGQKRFGNVIGFNSFGITIGAFPNPSKKNIVQGNYIGIDRSGRDIANRTGIYFGFWGGNGVIGYPVEEEIPINSNKANTIAFNADAGIGFRDGQKISTVQITVRGNTIYENGELGLDLGEDGVSSNDDDDSDIGPNMMLNYPVVSRAFYRPGSDEIAVEYTISSDDLFVSYPLTVDAYIVDDSTSGEGKTYIGTDTYTAMNVPDTLRVDASTVTWGPDDYVVLTTTDAVGNTSEFSPPVGPLESSVGSAAWLLERETLTASEEATVSVYPNPFNPTTTITLFQTASSHVRIAVHGMTGRQVAVLHDGELSGGSSHTFTFDGSGLASGTYLLRIVGEGRVESQPIMLLK